MAFNGSGVFSLVAGNPVVTGTVISSTTHNNTMSDIANNGLTNCITKDGQTNPTANLKMATFRHTGVGNASARTDYAAAGQVQDSSFHYAADTGAADAYAIALTPAITAYAAGQTFRFLAGNANTGASTLAVSGLAAKTIKKNGNSTDLAAGDIPANAIVTVCYDGTVFQITNIIDNTLTKGVTAGDVVQVDQTLNATTRAATTTLGTSLNHTLSDTSATITAFNGVAGVTYHCRVLGGGNITNSAGLIVTQTGADITTVTDDTFDVEMITGTTCRLKNYQRASGEALVSAASQVAEKYALVREEQTSGTDGGTFTSGAYQTRVLNTVVYDAGSIVSLSSNQVTLQAGTYRFRVYAPGYGIGRHKARLYNITDAAVVVLGTSARSDAVEAVVSSSEVVGRFTIASAKVFEVQHRCSTTKATDGFGSNSGLGDNEVYAYIEIWQEV